MHSKTYFLAISLPFIALMGFSAPSAANVPVCTSATSDSDNDGWGWENNASCVVDNSTNQSQTANEQTTTSGQVLCSSPSADPDGDGWGWENNASCLVGASSNDSTNQTVTGTNTNGRTVCSSATFDPDGDGWGWENNASCIFSDSSIDVSSNSTGESPATSSSTTKPQCSAAVSDEDGDGWGWENNQSCVVSAADETEAPTSEAPLPACSVPALDTNNDGIGRENSQDCSVETPVNVRIMALGDSITHGSSRGPAASYRRPFNTLLTSNTCQFEMVGSQTSNHFHNTFISPHEGYNGHTADQILNGHVDNAGNNEGISVTSNRYQPHVVLLHIGSNDMRLGQNIEQTVGEIDQIISILLASDSAPVVFLANVIPWWANATVGANVEILGDRIEAYVTQLNNPRVRMVDVRSGFTQSMMLSDNAHPNPVGEQHIADRFFAAYDNAGFCR